MRSLTLTTLSHGFAVCRLDPATTLPAFVMQESFYAVTRTEEELSIVLPEASVPAHWTAEKGWRCLKVEGPLDFGMTGILASLSTTLAEAGISLFALSTYDTDYLLVKEENLERAKVALSYQGHRID